MLVIEVELLHGVFHGDVYEQSFWLSREPRCEWPPSPARMVSALASPGPDLGDTNLGDSQLLRRFEAAKPPTIYAVAHPAAIARTARVERFVVEAGFSGGSVVQNYPGKSSLTVREGEHLAPKVPFVYYAWDDIDLSDSDFEALRARAHKVGYLGTSEFPAAVTAWRELPEMAYRLDGWTAHSDGRTELPVSFPGHLQLLDALYQEFRSGGAPRRGSAPKKLVRYRSPLDTPVRKSLIDHTFWLRFPRALPGSWALQVAEALRSHVIGMYASHFDEHVPSVLHGHDDDGLFHAMYVALPNVGFEHSTGDIHGAAVMLPNGVEDECVAQLGRILLFLSRLKLSNGRTVSVESADVLNERRVTTLPSRWSEPSMIWASAYPVVHERFTKGNVSLADIRKWCNNAGLPAPTAFQESRTPFLRGAPYMRSDQVRRKNQRNPYSHLRLRFDERVEGPMVVGAMRHFGIGLFAPVPNDGGEV